jgi:hypothetical protein
MTDRPRDRISRRPGPLPVVAGALALFLVAFSLLAFRQRARDAALVAAARPALQAPPGRRVLERKVIVTKLIVTVRRDDGEDGGHAVVTSVAPASSGSLPAAAPAAAPAAPAPLTTRTS